MKSGRGTWKLIVGILCIVGGVGTIIEDPAAGIFGLLIGFALFFWWLKSLTKNAGNQKKQNVVYYNDSPNYESQHIHKMYSLEKPYSKKRLQELKKCEYVVFDLETTGLNPQNDRIIEFALIRVLSDGAKEQISSLVNPRIHINERIQKITGICDDDIKDLWRVPYCCGYF